MAYWIEENNGQLKQIDALRDWRPDPNGPTYPNQLLDDPAFRAEHGVMTERVEGAPADQRYYVPTQSVAVVAGEVVKTWENTLKPVEHVKAAKLAEIAQKRYEKEVGGVDVGGTTIQTDRESRLRLDSHRAIAKEDPAYTVNWKTPSGWVMLDAAQIVATADAGRAHVQAAFDWEAAHVSTIYPWTDAQSIIDYEVT